MPAMGAAYLFLGIAVVEAVLLVVEARRPGRPAKN